MMGKKSGFVLFFTDKFYRWSRMQYFKLKLSDLPIIKDIVIWNHVRKFRNRTKNMTSWERYMEVKEIEARNNKLHFISLILNLKTEMTTRDGANFEEAKSNLLAAELINEPEFKEFKSWVESLDLSEENCSKFDEVIQSLIRHDDIDKENTQNQED